MKQNEFQTKWIFAAGMRRAASTLHYHLIREVVEIAGGHGAGWVKWQEFEEVYNKHDGKYPFVVVKTHVFIPKYVPLAQKLFDEDKAIAFLTYRDIRDIAASLIGRNKYVEEWGQVVDNIPVIIQEYEDWISLAFDKLSVSRYERFVDAIEREIYFIQGYLALNLPDKVVDGIVKRHTLSAHRELISNTEYPDKKFSPDTLFWNNHLDNGEIGRYKTELLQPQIEELISIEGVHNWLVEKGYIDENSP